MRSLMCMRPLVFICSLFALGLSTFYPQYITNHMGNGNIYLVCLSILGICVGFIYGVGFVARSGWGRLILNPVTPLALMIVPVAVIHVLGH